MKRKKQHFNQSFYRLGLIGIILFSVCITHAQTVFHVSTTGNDSNDGLSWVTPLRNVQTALSLAVAGDEIWVAQGTYYADEGLGQTNNDRTSTFQLKAGVKMLGGFFGVNAALLPRDPTVFQTILSGDLDQNDSGSATGQNSYHVVTGVDNAFFDGFVITNGLADGTNPGENKGGGIFNDNASPIIRHCLIRNNVASEGGGMYNGNSMAYIYSNQFVGNSANFGGAVYNNNSSASFVAVSFMENSSPQGGAIYNTSGTMPNTFVNCIIAGNLATQEGGGIYNIDTPIVLTNCTVTGNNASIEAGAVYLENTNTAAFQNTILWNNMANNVTNLASSTLTETNSTTDFMNSLVENFTPASQGGTPGILSNADPIFIQNLPPSSAPASGGFFRLHFNSPALNVGDNTLNTEPNDIQANPRIQNNTIDLGAIEGEYTRVYFVSENSGDDSKHGLTWDSALRNVQTAINLAIAGDQVWVKRGTYYPDEGTGQIDNDRASTFTLKEDVGLYGGFFGHEKTIGERILEDNETILSGDLDQNDSGTPTGTNAYHVVSHANGFSRQTILNGFTIKGGLADGTNDRDKKGGGMILEFCDMTIENCLISGNEAANDGGGIYNESSTFVLTKSRVAGNTATQGGGIFNIFDAMPDINNTTFSGNTAISGAGAFNNLALPIYTNCVFELNSATASGGGMLNDTASGDVTNTIFRGNSAANGGGVYNINFASSFFTNCLFMGNKASASGGAMDNSVDAGPQLINCTVSGNSAAVDGGGIYNNNVNISVKNTIVWNNEAGSVTNTASASIDDDNGSSTIFTNASVANFTVSGGIIANTDPTFISPVNPSTAPSTAGNFRLLTNSNAIDVGDNSSNTQTNDLDGNTRIQNGTIDLGAYEGATTVTVWQSNSSIDWDLGANWSNGVPTMAISAIIPTTATAQPEIDPGVTYQVKDLTIESTRSLMVNSDTYLTVNGNLLGTGDLFIESGASVIVGGTSSVRTTYRRTIPTTSEYFISSPVVGQDIDDFANVAPLANGPNANDRFLRTYNNTTESWDYYQVGSTNSGDFQSGAGKSIKLTNSSILTFRGDFPDLNVSIPVTSSADNFNVIGNPFPSSVAANIQTQQATDLLTFNSNVLAEQTLWLISLADGTIEAINQASGATYFSPGQAFVIAANGNGLFQFPKAAQSHQLDNFKSTSVTNTGSFKLEMSNGSESKTTTIAYRSDATTGFDNGLDSSLFDFFDLNNDFEFYTQLVADNFGRKIAIQSLPDSDYETMVIPLGFKAMSGEEITITAEDITGLPAGYRIFIEDRNDNSFTSISEAGESFVRTLSTDADGAGRFFVHVTDAALSNEDVVLTETNTHIFLRPNDYLQINGVADGTKAEVILYNITGQQIFKYRFTGNNANEMYVPNLRTGLYIVHLQTERHRTVKKILKR